VVCSDDGQHDGDGGGSVPDVSPDAHGVTPRVASRVRIGVELALQHHVQARLLLRLANGGRLERLAPLDEATWDGPAERFELSFDQDDYRPSSGRVFLDGRDLAALDDHDLARLRRTTIGLVFQFFNLMPQLSIDENVLLPIVLERAPTAADRERLDALLERLGLTDRRTHRPERLSGGERQRAALARALMPAPRVLLADEPTGALDSANATRIASLLRELAHDDGVCVVAVTHDERVAAQADTVIRLDDGRIVALEAERAAQPR
jgi:putative ABC transport system ATP-binding protein